MDKEKKINLVGKKVDIKLGRTIPKPSNTLKPQGKPVKKK